MKCSLCPRNCNIDRRESVGFCGAKDKMVVAKVMLHPYEEPMLTKGEEKSGAIFFSGCNLRCIYCQNSLISHELVGKELSPKELAEIFKLLEDNGAGNIDLVTPTHFSDKILEALKIYKPSIPVVWNTSGYEKVETLKMLEGYVDVYLTDFKYISPDTASELSMAKDYPSVIIDALSEMKRQIPSNVYKDGKLVKGIIVRHLVLPSFAKESMEILTKISEILGKNAIISLMSQYVPMGNAHKNRKIDRKLTQLEYKMVVKHALKLGLDNTLVQDLDSAESSYTPDFKGKFLQLN